MLRKRLVGVVTVKQGYAVQSIGYRRYLPLGRPELLVENLDRWGADEIIVQCIDRSPSSLGPDLEVLGRISRLGISTPLIYAGGIRHRDDAVKVVSFGADRIMIDAMTFDDTEGIKEISCSLGTQAVVAQLSLRILDDNILRYDYRRGIEHKLHENGRSKYFDWVSEVMLTDWLHDGYAEMFDERLVDRCSFLNKPLLCFGGISSPAQIERLLNYNSVVAVGIGNFLNYKEHNIQIIKQKILNRHLRPPEYQSCEYFEYD